MEASCHKAHHTLSTRNQDFEDPSLPVLSVSLEVKGNSLIAKRTGKFDRKETGLNIFHQAILSPKLYFSFNFKHSELKKRAVNVKSSQMPLSFPTLCLFKR